MKIDFKYNVYHVKKKRIFKSMEINLTWKYRKIGFSLLKPEIHHFKHPIFIYDRKFVAELLPGSKRQKNKLTWVYVFKLLFFLVCHDRIKIIRKHLYRKILKEKGLLK